MYNLSTFTKEKRASYFSYMDSRDRTVFAYEMDLEIRMANIYLKWAFVMEQK